MYNYPQGYSTGYPSAAASYSTAALYGQTGSTTQNAASSVFGSATGGTYAGYGSSTASALAAAYGYQQTNAGTAAAAASAAYAAQAAQQASRIGLDAYTAAASNNQTGYFSGEGYGTGATGTGATSLTGYGTSSSAPRSNMGVGATSNTAKALSSLTSATPKSTVAAPQNSGSSYSAYDAAVAAAASSLLQGKGISGSNMWMNKKHGTVGSAARPGFPNKRFGHGGGGGGGGNQNRDAQQFYCEVCKISCAGQLTYKEHLEGQRHKKKEALAKGENAQSLPRTKVSFRCDLCNVTCTGQDTYNAHVRGAKHQKTLSLCKKLGKPIPANEPTIIPPSEMGGTMPPPATAGNPIPTVGKRVAGISTVSFVQSGKLSSTGQMEGKKQEVISAVSSAGKDELSDIATKVQNEELAALIEAERNVKPVGEEYIESEKDSTGKVTQFVCKLCDCKFSDPNAKEIHLKGRRHRMQYKVKVDPSLEVDYKPTGRGKFSNKVDMRMRSGGPPIGPSRPQMFGPLGIRGPWFGAGPIDGRRFETAEDRHVQVKHQQIYPDDEQLTTIESLVTNVERALKKCSDHFSERDSGSAGDAEEGKEPERLLKGVMRVGVVSKGLLLKNDEKVDLVTLCTPIPTEALLKEVAQLLPTFFTNAAGDALKVSISQELTNACLIVEQDGVRVKCRVTFTSRAWREESDGGAAAADIPKDALSKTICLRALAQLRHAKWFQARCVYLQSCQITLRILRDARQRVPALAVLDDWTCELLVEKVLASCPMAGPLSIGDAFRRLLEAVASGVLLKSGPGLADPCEKDKTDVLVVLTDQQREDATAYAQYALRMLTFNQIFEILGMERLMDARPQPLMGDRKRPMNGEGKSDDEVKKDKKEEENDVAVKMEV